VYGVLNGIFGIHGEAGRRQGIPARMCCRSIGTSSAGMRRTRAHSMKSVLRRTGMREVEHFLPLYSSVRRWTDRRVSLELPLFPGYVFVRLPLRDRLRVVQIPSVVRLVGFNGLPTALRMRRSKLCARVFAKICTRNRIRS